MRRVAYTLAMAIAAVVANESHADACELMGAMPLQMDPNGAGGSAPGAAGDVTYTTQRGQGPKSAGCGKSSGTSCDDLGVVQLLFKPAADSDSDRTAVGYRIQLVSGSVPAGLVIPTEPVVPAFMGSNSDEASIPLDWIDGATDDQESVDFTLTLTPVDSNGNEGPTSPSVHVHDDGRDGGGCNVHHGRAGTMAVPLALVALALLRRRSRAGQ